MFRPTVLLALVLAVGLVACDGDASPTAAPTGPTHLTVGLGYIPSVQFAQFYRAQIHGYYEEAGLEITFQNQSDPDLITLVGQGAVDLGVADGTSIIPAVGQGIPVRYAATIYARFPNVLITNADSGIESPADLAGHSVGIPGRYGSSWIMLQAMLASVGLTPADIEIREYSDFGQAVALQSGQVDAATGFANNEPIQLQEAGYAPYVLTVDDITPLPGPGLVVGQTTITGKSGAVRAFLAATLRAMEEIIAEPEKGLNDAITAVPDLGNDREKQLAILQATIAIWQSPLTDQHGLGAIDRAGWQTSIDFMRGLPGSNVPANLTVDQLVTEDLLP